VRPLHLTLQGFKSHETKTEFDFSERTLFAIVGPTGAGKTTILDGISYALYAKTPKIQRSTKSLICSTKDSAEIELVFESEGRTFTLNRAIRRTGNGVHVLTDDAGEKINGETAVSEAVEEILRLDFNAFRSSVLLAQNQFDEFFRATPDLRMKILKGVFRFDQLDKMRDAAKAHRGEHELAEREIEGGLNEIPEGAPDLIEAAQAELASVDVRIAALKEIGPAEQKLTARLDKAAEDLAAAETLVEELDELADELPDDKVMHTLVAAEEQVVAPLEKAEKLVAELKADHKKAKEALAGLETKLGKEVQLISLKGKAQRIVELAGEIETATAAITTTKSGLDAVTKVVTATLAAEKKAITALEKLEEEHRSLHTAHAAHGLRSGLKPGDPCPVCEQKMKTLPTTKVPAAFKTIEDRLSAAKGSLKDATAASRAATDEQTAAKYAAETAATALKQLQGQAKNVETELNEALGKSKDPVRELDTRLQKIGDARESFERIGSDLGEAVDDLEGHRANEVEFREHRDTIFDDLVQAATSLKQPRLDRKSSAQELAKTATELRKILGQQLEIATKNLGSLGSFKETIEAEMVVLHRSADLAPGQTAAHALANATENRGRVGATITKLEKDIARAKELEKELKKVRARIDVYKTLFEDLANTKFIDFLLEDKRRLLSDLASAQLRDMTGRYRFDDAGTFQVIDEFNADAERNADSLSGGETFLASLALALGLAESVTRHGGRLQCFFLDEGFGSLDPDSLGRALDGIERIATQDRLIGLVSHVQGVSERIVDKIELDKDDDGMTIVKAPAGPTLRVVG
jgi:exonuclease SbcC